jgi:hypothetical protein
MPTMGNRCLNGGGPGDCRSDVTPGSGSTGSFLRPVNRYDLRLDADHKGRNQSVRVHSISNITRQLQDVAPMITVQTFIGSTISGDGGI